MNIPQVIINTPEMSGSGRLGGDNHNPPPLAPPQIYMRAFPSGTIAATGMSGGHAGATVLAGPPVVRVGELWLYQETVQQLSQAPWSRSPLEIAWAAVERGLNQMIGLPQGILTQHALMVAWGEFAQEIGLIDQLKQVAIPQKAVVHTPQAKLLTFLMGILTGIEHLKDLNEGAHPLAHDWPAIRAWGLVGLAHYSGISRTLSACDQDTVAAISQGLQAVSQPFIDQEVALLGRQGLPLIIDLDLAPRRVSNTSTTFPEAEFGWQGNEVGLGYEAALAALTSPTYGRLFLVGFHHPRNPVSLPRLQKMVKAAEAALGRRPRRRTDLVKQRLHELDQIISQRQAWLLAQGTKQTKLLARLETLPSQIARLEVEVTELAAAYQAQGRPERKYSRLAQARRRLASTRKKLDQVPQQLQKAEQAAATHRQRLAQLQTERDQVAAHLARLQADNQANAAPVTIILRVDAGFGTGPNLTWLIEMGYLVYTKAHNSQVTTSLLNRLNPDRPWTKVGKNAEMIDCGQQPIANCPYPLSLALERFHTPAGLKHSTLIAYRDDDQTLALPAWFDFYNGRQLIEAGIKETNIVFKMHPLKMRSPGGIALQEQFALFAANFVRWAAEWLRQRLSITTSRFDVTLGRVKTMVRVAANTSAWVIGKEDCLLLKFDQTGAYPGVELRLAGTWRIRPPILPRKIQNFDFRDDFPLRCT